MTNHELAAALRLCETGPTLRRCKAECPFYKNPNLSTCIHPMTAACAAALENHETHVAVLQKTIADLRKQVPRWISVEERLPEDDNDVLVLIAGKHKGITFEGAYMVCGYLGTGGWFCNEYPHWEVADVTHWMPLPEPPKEG